MTGAANAGPITRLRFADIACSEIALGRSAGSTRLAVTVWSVGPSTAMVTPTMPPLNSSQSGVTMSVATRVSWNPAAHASAR